MHFFHHYEKEMRKIHELIARYYEGKMRKKNVGKLRERTQKKSGKIAGNLKSKR